ncbi:serine-arginine protein 55 [Lasius niger]|uniref:Serine-arginine protein 55 n=1 Tax=Lasius niger TaxID=67767 RepID=A0A0J7L2F0_LASNI|nr:serine-arginine protein 55 [Lasius niger]
MSTRVFVGGLTYRVRERDLEKFFRKYGRIKEVAMKNGFAFVVSLMWFNCFFYSMVGTRVYVGGLPYGTRERDLERFFRGYGRFRDVLIKNGYGFVEFDDYRDADDAVYELNGKELLGERYGPPTRTEYRLTVENLSSRVSWQDLKDYMRQAGEVTYADAHKQRRNEGVVEFATYSDLKNAIDKLDDTELNGRRIRLIEDKRRGAAAALVATVAVARVPNLGHTRNPSPSLNPNLPSAVAHAQSPNQETAQSRNLSQSPNPDLVLGPRLRGQSPGRSPNPKPSLPQRIDRAVSVPEATGPDPGREANTARAVAALVRP